MLVVKGENRNVTALWEQHVKRFRHTRLVRCIKCTEFHLIPGCMATPRDTRRRFQSSDNFLDEEMGSRRCRERFPRIDGRPEWMDRWQAEVDALRTDDGARSGTATEDENVVVLGSTPTGSGTNLPNDGA